MTDRQRRVMAVWNWLPAVRVVAEYESIQRAARELAVSPSALSRTIKLAEDAVGAALFVRAASGITLTEAGATLLGAVRSAMRIVDDGLESLVPLATGHFVAGYSGPVSERLLSSAAALLVVELGVGLAPVFELRRIALADVTAELLRGHLDVALTDGPITSPEIASTFVADVPFGIYRHLDAPDIRGPCVRLVGIEGPLMADALDSVERAAAATGYLAELPLCAAAATFSFVEGSSRSVRLHAARRRALDERTSLADRLVAIVRGRVIG